MKLPIKYQGITPGEWVFKRGYYNATTALINEPGTFVIEDKDGDVVICSRKTPYPDRKIEMIANAAIMADSPRLAAAVVLLREKLESVSRYAAQEIDVPFDECIAGPIGEAREALDQTKEWAS